jgi:hypothetical protein
MISKTTVRKDWTGNADLGEAWRLHKPVCGQLREARCQLKTHELGWELLLVVNGGDLCHSQVCRGSDEVLSISERWKSSLVDRGWR